MNRLEPEAVSFQDASSCFSEEEWTQLQEWQKKLCGNLMKEINQALISLGPLIASSVFSLKAKEMQMLYTKNSQESERHCVNASPSLVKLTKPCMAGLCCLGKEVTEPITSLDSGIFVQKAETRVPVSTNQLVEEADVSISDLGSRHGVSSFSIKDEDLAYCKDHDDSTRIEISERSTDKFLEKAEAPVPVSTNQLVEEVDVSISDLGSRHGAISFSVEEDDLAYCKDHDDSTRIEISESSTGIFLQKSEERVQVVEEVDASIIDPESRHGVFSFSSENKELAYCKDHDDSTRIESSESFTEVPVITAVFSLCTKQEEEMGLQKTLEPKKRTTDLSDPGSMISKESSFCGESKMNFTHESTLNQRQTNVLEEKSPFTDCDARFIRNISLLHQETKETGAQSILFENCDKNFTHNAHVQNHQRTHIGDKPYLCNECGKSFTRSTSLKRHQIVHTGNNPFPCTECERCFVYKADLDHHLRLHRGEKFIPCNICGKTFMYRSQLQRHLIIHTGERPFLCTKCDKRFTLKFNLITHQKLHTRVSLGQ
ncbi:uncharacterized protein LOC144772194 isoform X3 [Lissotriton helveticus]